jgi:sugar phosphate isomerase/epimerase
MALTRRAFLGAAAAAALAVPTWGAGAGANSMGIAIASYGARWGARLGTAKHPKWKDALDVLGHCRAIGAGGLQIGVRDWAGDFAAKVRDRRDAMGLYLEGQIVLPREEKDVERFDRELSAAREAGITILRTAAGNRRYEDFDSAEGFARFKDRAWRSLTLCEPLLKRHGVVLAVENHKDWRVADLLEMLKRLGSERVGVTLDTGNSIALLEDPMEVVEALAPHALSIHIKDMAVREYEEGFLLSEIPLGEGFLDLARIIDVCRRHNPKVRFNLEMITRDPLRVPCMTEKYWATMTDVRGRELARTMGMVRKCASKAPLPRTTGLSDDERIGLEDEHVARSFAFAKEKLKV